jgi:hypothetical protein
LKSTLKAAVRAADLVLDTPGRWHANERLGTTIIKSVANQPYLQILGELSKAPT